MELVGMLAIFAGGYVAAVFTWDTIHKWAVGVEGFAAAMRAKATNAETKS